MLVSRRTFAFSKVAAVTSIVSYPFFRPLAVHAENKNIDINKQKIDVLYKRDKELVKKDRIDDILKWEAIKDKNTDLFMNLCKTNTISDNTIEELYFMTSFYSKPLSIEKKINARNILYRLYEKGSAHEKEIILNIMQYFELLE